MNAHSFLDSIRIVMINTSHSGNIGSAARAMRVMGLYNLTLVNPKKFPSPEAESLASGALDVLKNAQVLPTLEEAIADCHYVFGTSARSRYISQPQQDIAAGVKKIHHLLAHDKNMKIAILFGTERSGLTNDEVDRCHEMLFIPTENTYNSLNISAAIQVVSYELRKNLVTPSIIDNASLKNEKQLPATHEQTEGFFQHLEKTLININFLNLEQPNFLMKKLRRLYNKAELTTEEINILRGILTETERKRSHD